MATISTTAGTAKAARKTKRDVIASLRQPKVAIMLMLGFSSGLPFLLTGNTLGYWMRDEGTALTAIGFLSWVGLAYSVKFLWAPFIDRLDAPLFGRFGRRRGWLIISQLLIAVGLVSLSVIGLRAGLVTLGIFALLVAFSSSTQDIVVDAWRIEAASNSDELGLLSAAYQLGYRGALLVTDALILISRESSGLAGIVLDDGGADGSWFVRQLCGGGAAAGPGSPRPRRRRGCGALRGMFGAVIGPFREFFRVHGWMALLMLAVISLYRLPEFLMGPMANPFYHDLGLSKDAVGAVRASVGLASSLVGIAAGGFFALRFGYFRTLILGLILQSLVIANFATLVYWGPDLRLFACGDGCGQFRGRGGGRGAGDVHVQPDERRLHGDAVCAAQFGVYVCREVCEGIFRCGGRAPGGWTDAAGRICALLYRCRLAGHSGADPVHRAGARHATGDSIRLTRRANSRFLVARRLGMTPASK